MQKDTKANQQTAAKEKKAQPAWKKWMPLVWLVLIIGALVGLYFHLDALGYMEMFKSIEALQAYVEGWGVWAPVVFILLQIAQVICAPIPGNVTTLAGGAMFGFLPAFLYSTLAIFLGSLVAFGLGRWFGRPIIDKLAPKDVVDKYLGVLAQKQKLTLGLLFLLPFFPDDVLCLLAGLTGYTWPFFMVLVLVTRPWGLLFSALVGAGTLDMPLWAWIVVGAVSAAALYLSARYGAKLEDWLLKKVLKKTSVPVAKDAVAAPQNAKES